MPKILFSELKNPTSIKDNHKYYLNNTKIVAGSS